MRFGAHVSVASGYEKTLAYALSVGCECIQIFAKSPRQWHGPPVDSAAAEVFVRLREDVGFGPVFTHTAYLINIATNEPLLREKSILALADELVRGSALGAKAVVTHVGSAPDGDLDAAAHRVGEAAARAFELAAEAGGSTRLLLENTAGAGSSFGCDFADLEESVAASGLPPERLGVCLDTCHAFAYGFALDTRDGWDEVVNTIGETVGRDRLGLVHANDCLYERGSRRDRHAWIGEGFIGIEGFTLMVCTDALDDICAVTEMHGEPPAKDLVNLGRLKSIREACFGDTDG